MFSLDSKHVCMGSKTPDSRQSLWTRQCFSYKYYLYNSALISWGLKTAELPDNFNKKQQIPCRFDSKHFTPWEGTNTHTHTHTHTQLQTPEYHCLEYIKNKTWIYEADVRESCISMTETMMTENKPWQLTTDAVRNLFTLSGMFTSHKG